MKKFIVKVLFISLFFIGLGAMVKQIVFFFHDDRKIFVKTIELGGSKPMIRVVKKVQTKESSIRSISFNQPKEGDCKIMLLLPVSFDHQ